MVEWHHQLNGHGFGWTPRVGDGQGGLPCCRPWGRKESDRTERLNRTALKMAVVSHLLVKWTILCNKYYLELKTRE